MSPPPNLGEVQVLHCLESRLCAERGLRVRLWLLGMVMAARATSPRRVALRCFGVLCVATLLEMGDGCPASTLACLPVGVAMGLLPLVVAPRGRS